MAGVLNQLLLGLLEALGLALPGLNQRPLGLARATIAGLRFATRLSADGGSLGTGSLRLLTGTVGSWHRLISTPARPGQTGSPRQVASRANVRGQTTASSPARIRPSFGRIRRR